MAQATQRQTQLTKPQGALGRLDPYGFTPPRGEPLAQFEERVLGAIKTLYQRCAGEHLLLVTHAGVMRLMTLWVWFSGGLHLDGLADTADAWVGGYGDPERTLNIMKDPTCGPVGVISLVLLLLLKFAALVALLQAGQWGVLLLAPWLGRWVLPLLLYSTPYVRPGGLGQGLVKHMPRRSLPMLLVVHGLAMLLFGWTGILALLITLAVLLVVRHYLCERLGGTTGDTAGALVELVEVAVLVGCAVI